MLNGTLDMRLLLWVGPKLPQLAPPEIASALTAVEITSDVDDGDGFQVTFRIGQSQLGDYELVRSELIAPFSRMRIGILLAGQPTILADGVITHHQLVAQREPGVADLVVMGRDLGVMLDLKERRVSYQNETDFNIAQRILQSYIQLGIRTQIVNDTDGKDRKKGPSSTDLIRNQLGTDLAFLRELAQRYGFVFYIEPTDLSGSTAYFGPQIRSGEILPALSTNPNSASNVSSLQFTQNAFMPATASGFRLDESKGNVPVSASEPNRAALSQNPLKPRRELLHYGLAKYDQERASVAIRSMVTQNADAVTAEGQLETVRYGAILRPHRLVRVADAGDSYDGQYYVRRVTHRIQRDQYTQSFSLSREGTGATGQGISI